MRAFLCDAAMYSIFGILACILTCLFLFGDGYTWIPLITGSVSSVITGVILAIVTVRYEKKKKK